jgi:octaprenyl-diphosphate synthase
MSATLHSLGRARAPSLDPMIQLVSGDLNHVNAVILERMQSEVALIPSSPATSSPAAASACGRC